MNKRFTYALILTFITVMLFNLIPVSAETPEKTILDVIGEDASLLERKKKLFEDMEHSEQERYQDSFDEILSAGIDSFILVPDYYCDKSWTLSKETIEIGSAYFEDFYLINREGQSYEVISALDDEIYLEIAPYYKKSDVLHSTLDRVLDYPALIKTEDGTILDIRKATICNVGHLVDYYSVYAAFCETDEGNYVVWVEFEDKEKPVHVDTEENFRRIAEEENRRVHEKIRQQEKEREAEERKKEFEEKKPIIIAVCASVFVVVAIGVTLTVVLVKKKKRKAGVVEVSEE